LGLTTLLVNPGRYRETLVVGNDSLTITAANSAYGYRPELYGAALPAVAGTRGIYLYRKVDLSYLDIRGWTAAAGVYVDTAYNAASTFSHLTIDSCGYGIQFVGAAGKTPSANIYNCTIDGNVTNCRGVQCDVNVGTVAIKNCILTNHGAMAIWSGAGTITYSYCDFYGNGAIDPFGAAVDGGGNLEVNPLFREGNDYRPRPTCRALIRGNPTLAKYIGAWNVGYSSGFGEQTAWGRQFVEWGR